MVLMHGGISLGAEIDLGVDRPTLAYSSIDGRSAKSGKRFGGSIIR